MADELASGLYEKLVSRRLARDLALAPELDSHRERLDPADSHEAFARYVDAVLKRALKVLPESDRIDRQLAIANGIVEFLRNHVPEMLDVGDELLVSPPELLLAVSRRDYRVLDEFLRARPTIPLSNTALLTNARGEPNIGHEIRRELESADRVELLCAFIKFPGIRVIKDALEMFFRRGGRMRVLTTTYMAATERPAVDALVALGADVRIAYEADATRLHAKAWLFRRNSGYTTGFVGSSNLSAAAMLEGLEWNVRVSAVDTPALVEKFTATFESYWESDRFEPYDSERDAERLDRALHTQSPRPDWEIDFAFVDVQPRPHQRRILEELDAERERHGRTRNLVVAATGTGKTVIAALDYRRLRERYGDLKLLFVAHRREILRQSRSTFRAAMRDGSFGEEYVGGAYPKDWRHVFASVQSLAGFDLTSIPRDHFDVIIVDEFHHAAAPTYRTVLDHFEPKFLLGLTATPERADGADILSRFGGRFASEMRLWEALEDQLLVPFQYFGVHDDVSLEALEWRRGGYAVSDLDVLYTGNDARVAKVLRALQERVPNPLGMRALGFCVSIAHAEYMATKFNEAEIPARALSASSPISDREATLRALTSGEINVLFAVDLFNEGVDLPEVDTLLLLRPTESATVFLQQLGRGLRRAEGKSVLTVLDFIGQQHRRFRFDQRFRSLTGVTRRDVVRQIDEGFPFLPAGCHISLDPVARDLVLNNIRSALRTTNRDLVAELRAVGDLSLAQFLAETQLEVADIYRGGRTWTSLRRAANLPTVSAGPDEESLGKALARCLHVDDPDRIGLWRTVLAQDEPPPADSLDEHDQRLLTMLHFTLWGASQKVEGGLDESLARLWPNDALRLELIEPLGVLDDAARHVEPRLREPVGVPLRLHGRYSRDEIMAALGAATARAPKALREGAYFDKPSQTDVFFVTLQKSEKDYSPTTLYRDYAISRELFHWESQSKTTASSPTGKRFITSARPLIFAREKRTNEIGETGAYLCLGSARFVSYESERPMAITWRLDHPMPADFFEVARVAAS